MREINWRTYGETVIHPLTIGLILVLGVLIVLLHKRRNSIIPFLVGSLLITELQRVVVFSLDFNMIKIMLIFVWARIIFDSEPIEIKLNRIDKAFIIWTVSTIVFYTLLWQSSGAFVNRIGYVFNGVGIYFLFRLMVKSFDDVHFIINVLLFIALAFAGAMFIECLTRRNLFSFFGGVPEYTFIREGRLRCQGAFSHPILAGTFGASLLPFFVYLWITGGRNRLKALAGMISSTIITVASASSGPIMTYMAGLFALLLWPARRHLKALKWGTLFALIGLHLAMEAPVWALIARVGTVGGSTGYHRYALIDNFIRRFGEWFLVGTKSTAHWGWGLQDVTNQYVRIGIDGGLVTLLCFIALIALCFKGLGKALSEFEDHKLPRLCVWALGSTLFAHLVSFFGVSYFDQIVAVWYLLLGAVSSVSTFNAESYEQQVGIG
jgi:hypothetical protein